MEKGRFGIPRPLGIGPLAPGGFLYGQPETEDEMQEELVEIIQEKSIDVSTSDPDEVEEVKNELIQRTFPDSELKRSRLKECLQDWGNEWASESLDSTGQSDATPLEALSKALNGCRGMVETNTLEVPSE